MSRARFRGSEGGEVPWTRRDQASGTPLQPYASTTCVGSGATPSLGYCHAATFVGEYRTEARTPGATRPRLGNPLHEGLATVHPPRGGGIWCPGYGRKPTLVQTSVSVRLRIESRLTSRFIVHRGWTQCQKRPRPGSVGVVCVVSRPPTTYKTPSRLRRKLLCPPSLPRHASSSNVKKVHIHYGQGIHRIILVASCSDGASTTVLLYVIATTKRRPL